MSKFEYNYLNFVELAIIRLLNYIRSCLDLIYLMMYCHNYEEGHCVTLYIVEFSIIDSWS